VILVGVIVKMLFIVLVVAGRELRLPP